jgi:glycine hydroxymethyltransferase
VITGAPALTTRGFKEADFERVVDLLDKGVKISLGVMKSTSQYNYCFYYYFCYYY